MTDYFFTVISSVRLLNQVTLNTCVTTMLRFVQALKFSLSLSLSSCMCESGSLWAIAFVDRLLLFYSTQTTTATTTTTTPTTTAKQWKILFIRHLFFTLCSPDCTEKKSNRPSKNKYYIMDNAYTHTHQTIRARGISSLQKLTIVNITGFLWINFQCSTLFMWSLTYCMRFYSVRYALECEQCHCWF